MFKVLNGLYSLMGHIQFIFTINGLENVFSNTEDKLKVDDVLFYLDGKHKKAKIVVDAKDPTEAEVKARDLVSRSLSKAIFAYNTEASIDKFDYELLDHNHEHPQTEFRNGFLTIFSIGMPDPKVVLSKISQIKPEKKDILDLALAYYRLGFSDNAVKIQTLFSSMNVLVRDIRHMKIDEELYAKPLRCTLSDILQKEEISFCKETFEKEWKKCYSERNNIAHGGVSNLVDAKKEDEHLDIVSKVGYWTLTVFNHYIDMNQRV